MDKQEIVAFFDRLAPDWDAGSVRNDAVIDTILDYADIIEGVSVLDIGCGTGFLVPDYLERQASQVLGIDISEKMIAIAKEKFTDPRVSFLCADAETVRLGSTYDRCVIFNAFPHFPDPSALIGNLAAFIKKGGILTIAHGHSREEIDCHHMAHARTVSVRLMDDDALSALLAPYFDVVITISDGKMQQIVGVRQ